MAQLTITIDAPDWTVHDLQMVVHNLDALESTPEEAIAPENVTAWDVIQLVASGQLTLVPLVQEGLEGLRPRLEDNDGDMHRAFDGVIVNEMKD